ncbi:hypothetical protein LINGRAHAP2_LOCUS5504 [Linum grandiflorum]
MEWLGVPFVELQFVQKQLLCLQRLDLQNDPLGLCTTDCVSQRITSCLAVGVCRSDCSNH